MLKVKHLWYVLQVATRGQTRFILGLFFVIVSFKMFFSGSLDIWVYRNIFQNETLSCLKSLFGHSLGSLVRPSDVFLPFKKRVSEKRHDAVYELFLINIHAVCAGKSFLHWKCADSLKDSDAKEGWRHGRRRRLSGFGGCLMWLHSWPRLAKSCCL